VKGGSPRRLALRGAVIALVGVLGPGTKEGAAQIISPGKLSEAHADLEGIRGCTDCHELRTRGVSRQLCLACHEPLARRLAGDSGFHARLAEGDCATCHKEHLGRAFNLVKLDTLEFDHTRTGFVLEGAHEQSTCRACHRRTRIADPEVLAFKGEHDALGRTFLGLPTGCASCHLEDDPHGGQFDTESCDRCHRSSNWEEAPAFSHEKTSYVLTGRHRDVSCDGCHIRVPAASGTGTTVRYASTPHASCSTCHNDPHAGSMPGACASCHATSDWLHVDRGRIESDFDHRTTGFLLEGRHATASCAACHGGAGGATPVTSDGLGVQIHFAMGTDGRPFPRPVAEVCSSCHLDYHDGVFQQSPGGADCTSCHGQSAWLPSGYDLARHQTEAVFQLEGAHVAVACADCHRRNHPDRFDVRLGQPTCAECHGEDDPHTGQFEDRGCETCHDADSFRVVGFDHGATRFPLDGAHQGVTCGECHTTTDSPTAAAVVLYRPLGTDCRDCHGDEP